MGISFYSSSYLDMFTEAVFCGHSVLSYLYWLRYKTVWRLYHLIHCPSGDNLSLWQCTEWRLSGGIIDGKWILLEGEYVIVRQRAAVADFTQQVLAAQLRPQWRYVALTEVFAQLADFLDLQNVDAQHLNRSHHLATVNYHNKTVRSR